MDNTSGNMSVMFSLFCYTQRTFMNFANYHIITDGYDESFKFLLFSRFCHSPLCMLRNGIWTILEYPIALIHGIVV